MGNLVGWLFIIMLLALVAGGSGGRSEEQAGPTVVVNAAPQTPRSTGNAANVIGFLAALWLVAYVLTQVA